MYYPNPICAEYIGENYDLRGDTDPECFVCPDRGTCGLMKDKQEF